LPEHVQATLRGEAAEAGLQATFLSADNLKPIYLRYAHLHVLFPDLAYPQVERELKTLAAGREPAAAMSSEPSWIISGMASRNSPAANLATGLSVGTTQRASLRMIGLVRLKMGPVIATNGVGHEILQHPRVVGMGGLRFQVGHRLDSREVEQPMATKRDRSLCARGN